MASALISVNRAAQGRCTAATKLSTLAVKKLKNVFPRSVCPFGQRFQSATEKKWDGDSDGQHAALLQAIGEIEPDAEEQSQAWSQAIFPVDGGQSSMVFNKDTQSHCADFQWATGGIKLKCSRKH